MKSDKGGSAPARWVGLVLLWGLLVSPVLLWPFVGGALSWRDPLVLFNLGLSLLWAAVLHFSSSRPARLHVWLLPLYAIAAIDIFLLINFDARLTSGYISIALTDHADAGEMVATYWRSIAAVTSVFLVVFALGVWLLGDARIRPQRGVALGAAVLLLLAYGAYVGRSVSHGTPVHRATMDLAQKENSAPFGAFWQLALALDIQRVGAERAAQRQGHDLDARLSDPGRSPEVILIVVGESARPQNWSLYGYGRDTAPLLRQRRDHLVLLKDLLTTAPHTSVAVPSLLSLASIDRWDRIQSESSIVRAFAQVGFKTTWLSTQPADSWAGIIPIVAQEADHRRYFDHKHDEVLIPEVDALLQGAATSQRQLIVLHTKGSHFEYERRYPPSFARFASPGADSKTRLVDTYDNSLLYTDWVLNELIEVLRRTGRPAALVYASDHGQNLYDDDRGYFGHALGTEYDARTAGFLWVSDQQVSRMGNRLDSLRANAPRPVSLADLSHTLLDLAGIEARGLDPRRSLLNDGFQPSNPRQLLVRGQLRDERSMYRVAPTGTPVVR